MLKLNCNKIAHIPNEIAQLTSLKTLDLSSNQINDVNPIIFVTHLTSLNLSHNIINSLRFPSENSQELHLKSSPENDFTISNTLACLNLSENPLQSIPNALLEHSNLLKLSLENTEITKPDLEKLEGLLAYTERRKDRLDIAIWNDIQINWDL
mmetsp:Transcript_15468/g.13505  ORF Transcript_15468/g.13505 Transcript_15468/m.13505 type:complete len:153 (+) Transcript_15468:337-795(+)